MLGSVVPFHYFRPRPIFVAGFFVSSVTVNLRCGCNPEDSDNLTADRQLCQLPARNLPFINCKSENRGRSCSVHIACRRIRFVWATTLLVMSLACFSAGLQPDIQSLLTSAHLDGMRWPNFSDYRN